MAESATRPLRDARSGTAKGKGAIRSRSLRVAGLLLIGVALAATAFASLSVGSKPIPLQVVYQALTHFDGSVNDHLIIHDLRIPRTVIGFLVGSSLGLAGAVMQAITVLGVSSPLGYVWFAFAGTAVVSVVVYLIGSLGRGGATPVKLALAGAAIATFLGSITSAIVLHDATTLNEYRFWAVGSLAGRDGDIATQTAPFMVIGTLTALVSARVLNALSLGDEIATALGVHVGAARILAAVSVVLLVGAATAAAGPIAFVGLTIPHVARAITGPDYRWVLPYSTLLAPLLLLAADVVGRVIARPGEVQVGIVTAAVGAPVFIALARKKRLAEL